MPSRDVILYRGHSDTPALRREVARLRAELPDTDLVVIGYGVSKPVFAPAPWPVIMLTTADLAELPYPVRLAFLDHDWVNGSCDLPVLWFYRRNPHYEHYWLIEYDVRYTGSWRALFDELSGSQADLLATSIRDRLHAPTPHWWPSLVSPGAPLPDAALTKAFLPFSRVTRRGLQVLDAGCAAGWSGHSEVLWPTALRAAACMLEEVGGDGPYTPPARRGRHYTASADHWSLAPGTFVYRPGFRDADFAVRDHGLVLTPEPMLWHPVK